MFHLAPISDVLGLNTGRLVSMAEIRAVEGAS